MAVPFTAPGYHTVTPSLTIRGAAEAIEFYNDPYGHRWSLATHREDVSMDEIGRRAAAWMKSPPECQG